MFQKLEPGRNIRHITSYVKLLCNLIKILSSIQVLYVKKYYLYKFLILK